MASTFGLLVASLGRTPGGTRGVAILSVLLMVMLGGAWVPTFIFPAWLQRLTVVIPARWAVDGLDAMTWRGLGMGAAVDLQLAIGKKNIEARDRALSTRLRAGIKDIPGVKM